MYTVNMYYCYCILHHAPLHHSCHSPPIFPNFCHLSSIHSCLLSPFSCSFSGSFCSAFSTSWTILSVSSYFSQFLHPFPLYRSFSSFPNLTCSFSSTSCCPCLSVPCPFFPVHISHFPALFPFPFYLSYLFHFYLLSSFFSYLSSSRPFFYAGHASFSLFLSPLPTSHSHYSIFSVLTIHLFFQIPLPFHPVPVGVLLVLSL